MKPSEVIRYYLPFYAKAPSIFMCCMVTDCYGKFDDVEVPDPVSEDDGRYAARAIEDAIRPYTTLHTYLKQVDKEYLELTKYKERRHPVAHAYRVKWFEELASKLEKEGK